MRTPRAHVNEAGETCWRVRFRERDTQRSITFYGPRAQAEAEEFCRIMDGWGVGSALAWVEENSPEARPGESLDEWADHYITELTDVTDGTRVTYRRTYDRIWKPRLGHLPLRLVDRPRIAAAINELSSTYADKTVRNFHGLLSSMLAGAVYDGRITANPAKGIKLPRRTAHEAVEHRYLTHEEFDALVAAVPEHYRPLVVLLAGTGMRWGEAEALNVGDVDLDRTAMRRGQRVAAPIVRITKAVKWDGSKANRDVGPTKTRGSKRTLDLPDECVRFLRPVIEGRSKSERLFTGPRGGPLRHRTFYRDWRKACARAGLDPQPRIHDLRHTSVAWLTELGVGMPAISARLGHTSIKTTFDVYGHLLPDTQYAAAQAASVALSGVALPAVESAGPASPSA